MGFRSVPLGGSSGRVFAAGARQWSGAEGDAGAGGELTRGEVPAQKAMLLGGRRLIRQARQQSLVAMNGGGARAWFQGQ